MLKVQSGDATISYTKAGTGPTLVLVHGAFSDHENFWILARPALEQRFTVVSIARRGHGESSKTTDNTIEDETGDVIAVVESLGGDVFLLAHSGGSFCSLAAAAVCTRIKKLVLYEPPGPAFTAPAIRAEMYEAASKGDWDGVVASFAGEQVASLPKPFLATMVKNAPPTMQGWADMERYWADDGRFEPFRHLKVPVLLLKGSETGGGRDYADELAQVLPDAQVIVLEGQGHAAMLTAPVLFVKEVETFLLGV